MSTPDHRPAPGQPDHRVLAAEFDARRRALAERRGAPVPRMAQAGHPIAPATNDLRGKSTFFFLRDDELVCAKAGKPVTRVTGRQLDKALTSPGAVAVAAERKTASRMLMVAQAAYEGAKDDAARRTAGLTMRLMQFARTSVVSPRFAILTEVLARKFYSPTSVDQARLRAWARALSVTITRDDPASGMAELFGRGVEGDSGITYAKGMAPLTAIVQSDDAALAASRFGGPGCVATQYGAAECIDGAWDALCRMDPVLCRRCEIAGEVVRISPVALEDGGYRCRISEPARLREGECVVTLPAGEGGGGDQVVGQVRLQAFGVDGEDLHLVVGTSRRATREGARIGMRMLFDAQLDGTDLLLSPAPFLRPASQVYASRWSLTAEASAESVTVSRDVPLYVALAGA